MRQIMIIKLITALTVLLTFGCVSGNHYLTNNKDTSTQIHEKLNKDFEKDFSYVDINKFKSLSTASLPSPAYRILVSRGSLGSKNNQVLYDSAKTQNIEKACRENGSIRNRTVTGSCNNLSYPSMGKAESLFARIAPPKSDKEILMSNSRRPNPRTVSNLVNKQEGLNLTCSQAVSDLFWQWGQFVDHDLTLTPPSSLEEDKQPIPIGCDKIFNPRCEKGVSMRFTRSKSEYVGSIREQINEVTHFIDGSMIYGSDHKRARELRTNDGSGRLKTSMNGKLLPYNSSNIENETGNKNQRDPRAFFLAGDVRVNEQVGLIAIHTLFVREHNTLAYHLKKAQPHLSGEQVYQFAKTLVAAEIQHITYHEWLPVLLGGALPAYKGYDSKVNPSVTNEFSTAAFRFGHSMLSPKLKRLDSNWKQTKYGHLELRDAFFQPQRIVNEGGISPILRGLIHQRAQEVDLMIVDDVRNFLFRNPRAGMFDLATLNIQRGRDHGIGTFNEVRKAYSLPQVKDYSEITHDKLLSERFRSAYGISNGKDPLMNIDFWVAGLGENPHRDGLVGETFWRVMFDQFSRLRSGDRFWYQNYLPTKMQSWVNSQSLMQVIERNTDIKAPHKYSKKRNSFFSVL